ncbi:ferredoxin [Roseobacteraceae bacterium NS-SX3]
MSFGAVALAAAAQGLAVYGAVHPARTAAKGLAGGTLILLGTDAEFWPRFTQSPEYRDGDPDPVDRWSLRVCGALAARFGAAAHYPFGGPPYAPFVDWALASGRCFTSPSQMLVHDRYGMMVSFRGALHFDREFAIPEPPLPAAPCTSCSAKPCLTACPADALAEGGSYSLAACHGHLDSPEGSECLSQGCLARRACPLSRVTKRPFAQSAHHMRYFHPT